MQASECSSKPKISLQSESKGLEVLIETEHLYIQSYKEEDFEKCIPLYTNVKLTKYFDQGKPKSISEIEEIVRKGIEYFAQEIPLGLFSIFSKSDKTSFIGQVDLLPTDIPGVVELGIILHREHQCKEYCLEIGKAILYHFTEELNKKYSEKIRQPIIKVIASVHPKNYPCIRALKNVGMAFEEARERFGNPRLWYSYKTSFVKDGKSY